MVNSPLIRPYFLGGVALGGVARIPMKSGKSTRSFFVWSCGWLEQYVSCRDKIFLNIICCCFPPLVGVITCR